MSGALKVIRGGGAVAQREDAAPDADRNNRLLTKRVKAVVEIRYDADFDHVIGAEPLPGASEEARAEALGLVERSLAPASNEQIAMELARLKLTTAGRGLDQADLKATLAIYAEELRTFRLHRHETGGDQAERGIPADILATACRHGWKWFPTLEELLAVCRPLLRSRQVIAVSLRRQAQHRIADEPWRPPSEDDKRYVTDLVARWRAVFADPTAEGSDE